MANERITLIIPAFNEEESISNSIRYARSLVESEAVHEFAVIDDGSTDRTAVLAESGGAKVISLPKHVGKGGAFLQGALYCKRSGAGILLMMDADLIAVNGTPVSSMLHKLNPSRGPAPNMVIAQVAEGNAKPEHECSGQRAIRMKAIEFLFIKKGSIVDFGNSFPARRFTSMCSRYGLETALDWQIRPAAVLKESDGLFKFEKAFRRSQEAQMMDVARVANMIEDRMDRRNVINNIRKRKIREGSPPGWGALKLAVK